MTTFTVRMSTQKKIDFLKNLIQQTPRLLATQSIDRTTSMAALDTSLKGSDTLNIPLSWPLGATFALVRVSIAGIITYNRVATAEPVLYGALNANAPASRNSSIGTSGYLVQATAGNGSVSTPGVAFSTTIFDDQTDLEVTASYDSEASPAQFAANPSALTIVSAFIEYYNGPRPQIV